MFVYLAAPYWTADTALRGQRVRDTSRLTARLMEAGLTIFSPIPHGVFIAQHLREDLRDSHHFWLAHDFEMLSHAAALFIYCLHGWQFSYGLQREIEEANRLHLPIEYLSGEDDVEATARRYSHLTDAATAGVRPSEAPGARGFD